MFLVGVVFHFLIGSLAPDIDRQYRNPALFRDWSGWTSTYMTIHPFLYGPVFAVVFLRLRMATSIPSGIKGGLIYGGGVFCVGSLPVFLLTFASFQVSVEIMLSWIVQNLCQYLAAGVAIGAVPYGSNAAVASPRRPRS